MARELSELEQALFNIGSRNTGQTGEEQVTTPIDIVSQGLLELGTPHPTTGLDPIAALRKRSL